MIRYRKRKILLFLFFKFGLFVFIDCLIIIYIGYIIVVKRDIKIVFLLVEKWYFNVVYVFGFFGVVELLSIGVLIIFEWLKLLYFLL